MFEYLQGKIHLLNPTYVIVDCNGIGYKVHISLHTRSMLPTEGDVFIYVYQQIKEDAHTLYGFYTELERSLFLMLISVSGIGANTARTMLSYHAPEDIIQAIAQEDKVFITGIKGIGIKTAERVIVELKANILKLKDSTSIPSAGFDAKKTQISHNTVEDEALLALLSLGFTKVSAEKAVQRAKAQEAADSTVEGLIKAALRIIA